MNRDELSDLRRAVHSVLMTFEHGANEAQFRHAYKLCVGEEVPLQQYDFCSVREMMLNCGDVVDATSAGHGNIIYSAKVLDATKDLQNLIRSKKSSTKHGHSSRNKGSSSSSVPSFRWTKVRSAPPTIAHRNEIHAVNANVQRPYHTNNGAVVPANRPGPGVSQPSARKPQVAPRNRPTKPVVSEEVFKVHILEIFDSNRMLLKVELERNFRADYVKLMARLLDVYGESEPSPLWIPRRNESVAAYCIGMWFRGSVLGALSKTVSAVHLCDVGKIRFLEHCELRRLRSEFSLLPQRSVFVRVSNALFIPLESVDKVELRKVLASVVGDSHLEAKLPTAVRESFFGSVEVASELAFPGWTDVDRIPAAIKKYCKDRKDDMAAAVRELIIEAYNNIHRDDEKIPSSSRY